MKLFEHTRGIVRALRPDRVQAVFAVVALAVGSPFLLDHPLLAFILIQSIGAFIIVGGAMLIGGALALILLVDVVDVAQAALASLWRAVRR